jgi:tight adherence protein C
MSGTLLIATFGAFFVLLASIGLLLFYRDRALDRLRTIVEPRKAAVADGLADYLHTPAALEKVVRPFQDLIPRSMEEVSVQQKRLIRAGFRNKAALNLFYGAKVIVPIVLILLATAFRVYDYLGLFGYLLAAALGFLLPDFWLGNRISARQTKIRHGLPEALDLMVICTEAGLGLDQSMNRVALELKHSRPEISDELVLLNLEQKAGRPRDEALKNLAERTDIDQMRTLVTTLIQADTFGTSIAKTLRVYSDSLRTARRQAAEEAAAKTTVKLVFPLVLFIFPAIFVVALAPSAITVMEGMQKYL